jgi:uncharacterized repeat protein (TIGR04076 family)
MATWSKLTARVIKQEGTCEAGHKVGDEFEVGEMTPPGVCSFAFCALWPFAVGLQSGGTYPWEKDPDKSVVACPDPDNPVWFELERRPE